MRNVNLTTEFTCKAPASYALMLSATRGTLRPKHWGPILHPSQPERGCLNPQAPNETAQALTSRTQERTTRSVCVKLCSHFTTPLLVLQVQKARGRSVDGVVARYRGSAERIVRGLLKV